MENEDKLYVHFATGKGGHGDVPLGMKRSLLGLG